MESAFGVVLVGVVFLGAIAAVISLFGSSELYDKIGRGGMSLNEETEDQRKRSSSDSRSSTVAAAERDDEIRQLLAARNEPLSPGGGAARRRGRGRAPARRLGAVTSGASRPALG